jgi:hypothetical protein
MIRKCIVRKMIQNQRILSKAGVPNLFLLTHLLYKKYKFCIPSQEVINILFLIISTTYMRKTP